MFDLILHEEACLSKVRVRKNLRREIEAHLAAGTFEQETPLTDPALSEERSGEYETIGA